MKWSSWPFLIPHRFFNNPSLTKHHSNDQTIASWQQKYNQVNDNFMKSDHPAVARTKPRLSSPFPIANPSFGSPSPATLSFPLDPYNQSPSPGNLRPETDMQDVITSYNEYIIPIPDPKPEDVFTDAPSGSPARYNTQPLERRCKCVPHAAVAKKEEDVFA